MNKRKSIAWTGTLAFLVAGFLGVPLRMNATDVPDSENVSKLLSEAKTMAFQVKEDAVTMEGYTRMNVSWESHVTAVTQIKEHINALERQVAKLNDAKETASPWQKTAIGRINPFMGELEGYTGAIIEHLTKQPNLLATAEYKDYLEANADYAGDLAAMIGDFVDYGRTKERMERLTDQLEVPAH